MGVKKIDEMTQTLINDLIKRVGNLEQEIKELKKNPTHNKPVGTFNPNDPASNKQLKFLGDLIRDLDIDTKVPEKVTKGEAKNMIKEMLEMKNGGNRPYKNDNTTLNSESKESDVLL